MGDTEILKHVDEIEREVRRTSGIIKHSTPLTCYQEGPQLDLRDVIISGAISGRNILLNGSKSGCAKTHLAKLSLAALYGSKNYAILNIDPNLNEEKLYNIYFGAIKDGKSLDEMYQSTKLITASGVLLDEVNRAPQEVRNCLQAYLNNEATTPGGGKQQPTGIEMPTGERYQFKIGTCNEGKQYEEGTWPMDPAFRRRFALEIPVDLFKPTMDDNSERNKNLHTGHAIPETKGVQDAVLAVYQALPEIKLHPLVEEFLSYTGQMDNCIKSPHKTKCEKGFSVQRCEGCHARGLAGEQNFCGNAFAPSEGTQNDLNAVSRAFAVLRAYHSGTEIAEVSLADIEQAFPFVTATKLNFDQAWLSKYFVSGEAYEASKALAANIEQRIKQKVRKLGHLMTKGPGRLTDDDIRQMGIYAGEDPWAFGLRDCDYQRRPSPRQVA